jgi:hypothetical protein
MKKSLKTVKIVRVFIRLSLVAITVISVGILTINITVADGRSTQYKMMIEAFALMTGSFFQVVAVHDVCPKKYKSLKAPFKLAFNKYKARHSFLDAAKNKMYSQARREGGSNEASRLSAQVSKGIKSQQNRVIDFANRLSFSECQSTLSKIASGRLDLKIIYPKEVKLMTEN